MALDSVIHLPITADSKEANKVFLQLQKRIELAEQKMDGMSKKTSKGAKENTKDIKGLGDVFSAQAPKIGILTTAITTAYNEISKLIRKAEELKQLEQSSTLSFGDAFSKLQVQGNIKSGSADAKKLENALFAISRKFGADIKQVTAGATQFISSGGTIDQVLNGTYSQIVQSGVATNNQDYAGLSKSFLNFERGAGSNISQLTPADLRKTGVNLVGAYGDNVAESGDLDALGKIITSLVGAGLSKEDALSAITAAKQSEGSADAAGMAIKQFTGKLRTGRGNANFDNALKQMGLKAQDVDFVGEGLDDVLRLLSEGLAKAKPEDRAIILKNIFGEEASAKAESLIAKRGEIQSIRSKLSDESAFTERVDIGSTSVMANERRIQNDRIRGTKTSGPVTKMQEREMYKNLVMDEMRKGTITKLQGTQILADLDSVQGSGFEAIADAKEWFKGVVTTRLGSTWSAVTTGDAIPEYNQTGYDNMMRGSDSMIENASKGSSTSLLNEMQKTNKHLEKISATTVRDSNFNTGNNPITKGKP